MLRLLVGGLSIASKAYKISLGGKPSPEIDGFIGEQRVFIGWTQVWREQIRDERLRLIITSNPHAPVVEDEQGETMSTVEFDLLCPFEVHSRDDIRAILDAGFDVRQPIKGKSIANSLIEMYSRSDQFPDCLRLLLERGAVLDDPKIAPVLLDDANALTAALDANPSFIKHRTSLTSVFTPLIGASLLHVAAEFGNMNVMRVLLERGAAVEGRAAYDQHGLNGHTPIFHTVNSAWNRSAPLLDMLLGAGAKPDVRLEGITWARA